jgi:hypothetical protein
MTQRQATAVSEMSRNTSMRKMTS